MDKTYAKRIEITENEFPGVVCVESFTYRIFCTGGEGYWDTRLIGRFSTLEEALECARHDLKGRTKCQTVHVYK